MSTNVSISKGNGNIPVISINAKTLPEAWEQAVLALWDHGADIKTQYDKPGDPPSKDATVIISIDNPFNEPRIHRNIPGGPEELEAYRQEVVYGIHDHWINPEENKWTYTYSNRLFAYSPCENLYDSKSLRPFAPVNQIEYIINSLSNCYYTRRAQAITWQPTCDPKTYDPPCLQRLHFRMLENENNELVLNMNSNWRSRDIFKAFFFNLFALTDLQRIVAEKISININRKVLVGRYVDMIDSAHLYGSYFKDIIPEIDKMRNEPITNRVWNSDHPAFQFMTNEAKEKLAKDVDWYKKGLG